MALFLFHQYKCVPVIRNRQRFLSKKELLSICEGVWLFEGGVLKTS